MNKQIYSASGIKTDFEVMDKIVDRFLFVGKQINGESGDYAWTVIIGDWNWYLKHEVDIHFWFKQQQMTRRLQGMVLEFENEVDYMMFKLRWQG